MVFARAALLVCASALPGAGFAAAPPEFDTAPAPAWVEPAAVPGKYVVPVGQISDGVYYLLSDSQTRLEGDRKVAFRHYALKAVTENGVQHSANVEIAFDPSYQRLTLHSINVIRNGRAIEKLPTASVRILQREKELEYLIFDGSKTAHVFLDDVRVGDVVDYSYSLSGGNPVFGNRHFGSMALRWGAPLERLNARLLVPQGRVVRLGTRNAAVLPEAVARAGYQQYAVRMSKLPALIVEKDAPGWFDPYPAIEWSEFTDWAAVARWAAPLYVNAGRLSPGLQAEVERIRRAGLDDAGKLTAVLRFVQREVRYLGVEIGPGSHAPRMPNQVFERRFGDCKDKTLLTIAMLDALGIRAKPALVNTSALRGVRDALPTPAAFNHVIVRAELAGRQYWLDPTRATQNGALETIFQPDFGFALIVDPASKDLVAMRAPTASASVKTVHALLDASAGLDKPVHYTITTSARGKSAEGLRSTLASSNLQDLQKTYLNYYAGYYPAISVAAPMTVSESDADNRLTTVEHYLIKDFWPQSASKARREAQIYAPDMADLLRASPSSIRLAPLALAFPVDFTQTTEVLLPETWDLKPETTRVDDPAFEFVRVATASAKRLVLVDHYRSLKDHVPAPDSARHADSLKRARTALDYQLYIDSPAAPAAAGSVMARFNWSLAMLAGLLLLLFAWAAARLYRYDPAPMAEPGADPALTGLRGWLLLAGIGLVLQPVRFIAALVEMAPALAADNWARLTVHGGADYHGAWAPVLLFDLAMTLAQVVLAVLLLVLFFRRRRSLPRLYVGFILGSLLASALSLFLAGLIPLEGTQTRQEDWLQLGKSLLGAAIWCPYFLVSRRVRATFTRAWQGAPVRLYAAAGS